MTRPSRRLPGSRASHLLVCLFIVPGCHSPEDGRPRGGGHGGDGGNYRVGQVHVPSKIDGTRDLSPSRVAR